MNKKRIAICFYGQTIGNVMGTNIFFLTLAMSLKKIFQSVFDGFFLTIIKINSSIKLQVLLNPKFLLSQSTFPTFCKLKFLLKKKLPSLYKSAKMILLFTIYKLTKFFNNFKPAV